VGELTAVENWRLWTIGVGQVVENHPEQGCSSNTQAEQSEDMLKRTTWQRRRRRRRHQQKGVVSRLALRQNDNAASLTPKFSDTLGRIHGCWLARVWST